MIMENSTITTLKLCFHDIVIDYILYYYFYMLKHVKCLNRPLILHVILINNLKVISQTHTHIMVN